MGFSIRSATLEDVDEIVGLYSKVIEALSRIPPKGFGETLKSPLDIHEEKEVLGRFLRERDTVLLVAEQGSVIVGFLAAAIVREPDDLVSPPYLTVQYIYVDERARGLGVAKSLMRSVETWALERGIHTIELRVWSDNEPAKNLFQSLGYIPLEIRMAKRL